MTVDYRRIYETPPDVRWPGCFCPMCYGPLEIMRVEEMTVEIVTAGGWCCLKCEVVWMYDGTAGEWAEPDETSAASV